MKEVLFKPKKKEINFTEKNQVFKKKIETFWLYRNYQIIKQVQIQTYWEKKIIV